MIIWWEKDNVEELIQRTVMFHVYNQTMARAPDLNQVEDNQAVRCKVNRRDGTGIVISE